MRLVPVVLDWQDPGSAFSAAMQLAALAAVVNYFWADIRDLAVNSIAAAVRGHFRDRYFRFSLWIVLATVPIALAGLALAKLLNTCNSPIRSVAVIGWACIIMALLLAVAEITASPAQNRGCVLPRCNAGGACAGRRTCPLGSTGLFIFCRVLQDPESGGSALPRPGCCWAYCVGSCWVRCPISCVWAMRA